MSFFSSAYRDKASTGANNELTLSVPETKIAEFVNSVVLDEGAHDDFFFFLICRRKFCHLLFW